MPAIHANHGYACKRTTKELVAWTLCDPWDCIMLKTKNPKTWFVWFALHNNLASTFKCHTPLQRLRNAAHDSATLPLAFKTSHHFHSKNWDPIFLDSPPVGWSFSKAKPFPGIPWQRPKPFRSNPRIQTWAPGWNWMSQTAAHLRRLQPDQRLELAPPWLPNLIKSICQTDKHP